MLWIVSLPFYAWYNILGFNSFQAENLSMVSALFLSSFIIIRIYSHCTNNRNLPLNPDLFSDYDPFVVKHLFKGPRKGSSPIIFKAMLLDFSSI